MTCLRAALVLLAALLAGCSTPIGVTPATTQETSRLLMANALSTGAPSEWSRQVLHRNALFEAQRTDPEVVLDALYRLQRQAPEADKLFALAELSFLYAQRYGRRDHYLAAAVYAYAFVLPEDEKAGVSPLDPRLRLALDLYNNALAEGLAATEGETVHLASATHRLPFGSLRVTADPAQFLWAGFRFTQFVPVGHLNVRGMRNRYRQAGIGAPLLAWIAPAVAAGGEYEWHKRIRENSRVPVTAVLRLERPLRSVLQGEVEGRIELYTRDQTESLKIGGRDVPLEFEATASIAYQLEGSPIWDTELAGFRLSELPAAGYGLTLLQPHRPGRIPVVFVHGTASSPARWAEMYNELVNDPVLRNRYEFWMFQYATGQPVLYSASQLRRDLRDAVREIDPAGRDPALRRMVVIGHSQGGLLAKLVSVNSGTRFWHNITGEPFEDFDAPADTKAMLRESLFFEPVEDVERVVFIATPHRGSFRAGGVAQAIVRRLITMPSRLVHNLEQLRDSPEFAESGISDLPTSVDNMTPDTRFIRTLVELPFAPRIKVHSIIPVNGIGPPEHLDDGVVTYRSAHIESVESELVVRSSHSTQASPETIQEVRRILRHHLEEGMGPRSDTRPPP